MVTPFREAIGISSVVSAMIGLSTLLLFGVINWNDCLSDKSAWDSLTWFAVLIGMAGQLTNLGVVAWMSDCVAKLLQSLSLTWPASFAILQASYLLIHYLFASQTAHAGALYPAFLAMQIAAGVPGVLAALCLAFNNNLSGALAHYSGGPAALYYGGPFSSLFCLIFHISFGYRINSTTNYTFSFNRGLGVCSWICRSERYV